jgi:DNA-binding transcriptional regulator/RsmH inhibitor MraZ
VDNEVQQSGIEPPRGMFSSRMDEKGRMKMPVAFQQYISALPEKKLYVTSLDRRIGRIYPIQAWRENENFFERYRDDPNLGRKVAFIAADLGIETEMDSQGRITFPSEMRRELALEDQTLRLHAYLGHIEVLSEKIYEEKKRDSMESIAAVPQALEKLEAAGLK